MEGIIDDTILIVIGIVCSGVAGIVGGFFKKRTDKLNETEKEVEELRKRCWRIEKTIIILTKMQEDQLEQTHPELRTEWEELVRELLKGNGYHE